MFSPQTVFPMSRYDSEKMVKFFLEFSHEHSTFVLLLHLLFPYLSATLTTDLSVSSCSLCTHAESKQYHAQEGVIIVPFPLQRLWWQLSHFCTKFRNFKDPMGDLFFGKTNCVGEKNWWILRQTFNHFLWRRDASEARSFCWRSKILHWRFYHWMKAIWINFEPSSSWALIASHPISSFSK